MTQRFITWGLTFPWPPTWPLFWFWRAPGNVPAELQANERALTAARDALARRGAP